jgi:CRISPR/Cas system CSM-associated protein Csm2 small subunit
MAARKQDLEKYYREISSLYDMAEDLASTIESEFTKNPEAQLTLVEPLISQVADSADALSEEFVNVLEKPSRIKSAKGRVEGALRKLFMALEAYRAQIGTRSKNTLEALVNIADPIVTKIRKQAERIILIFMQLMEISLDRIMHKFEIEEFKRANDRLIATLPPILGH